MTFSSSLDHCGAFVLQSIFQILRSIDDVLKRRVSILMSCMKLSLERPMTCVCVCARVRASECSDARQADLQSRGRSHVPSYLQTWRRPETGSAHPSDHLSHGQSKSNIESLAFLPYYKNVFC